MTPFVISDEILRHLSLSMSPLHLALLSRARHCCVVLIGKTFFAAFFRPSLCPSSPQVNQRAQDFVVPTDPKASPELRHLMDAAAETRGWLTPLAKVVSDEVCTPGGSVVWSAGLEQDFVVCISFENFWWRPVRDPCQRWFARKNLIPRIVHFGTQCGPRSFVDTLYNKSCIWI